jgi:hypothetical protein
MPPDTPSPDTQSSAIIAIRDSEHPTISMPPAQLAANERALINVTKLIPDGADKDALTSLRDTMTQQLDAFEKRMDERMDERLDERFADFAEETTEGRLSRTELSAIAAAAAAGVGAAHKGNGKDSSPPSSIRSRLRRWHAIASTGLGLLAVFGFDVTANDAKFVRAIIAGFVAAATVMSEGAP